MARAKRSRGRAYRKRKGIKTCHCSGWWFPHRLGSVGNLHDAACERGPTYRLWLERKYGG